MIWDYFKNIRITWNTFDTWKIPSKNKGRKSCLHQAAQILELLRSVTHYLHGSTSISNLSCGPLGSASQCFFSKCSFALLSRSVVSYPLWLHGTVSMGILQARILEWVAMPSSRGSSPPSDRTQVSRYCRRILYHLRHQGSPNALWDYNLFRQSSLHVVHIDTVTLVRNLESSIDISPCHTKIM